MGKSAKNLKHAMKTSLRAVHATRKVIEKDVNALVKSGTVTAEQGKELARHLVSEANKQRKKLQGVISKTVSAELKKQSPYMSATLKKGASMSIKGIQYSANKAAEIANAVSNKVLDMLVETPKGARKKTAPKNASAKASRKARKKATTKKAGKKRSSEKKRQQ